MRIERVVTPALRTLRAYPVTALLLVAAGAAAFAAVLPVTALVAAGGLGPRLALPAIRETDLGIVLSPFAATAGALREAALARLFGLLLGVAAGVLGVGGITILALAAARATARGGEIRLRRAVGARRTTLAATELLEGVGIAAAALAAGGAAGLVAGRLALAAWPGAAAQGAWVVSGAAALGALAAILTGAGLPLLFARRASPVRDAGPATLGLVLPALQLGLALTVLAAGALLGEGAARLTTEGGGGAGRAGAQVFEITARGGADRAPVRAAAYAALLTRLERDSLTVSLTSPGTIVGAGPVSTVASDCGPCRWGGGSLYLPWHTFAAAHYLVSADTFRALAIPVLAGRAFTGRDTLGTAQVAIVNHTLAIRHFYEGRAVGRAIMIGRGADALYTVIGVVADRAGAGLGSALEPAEAVYLSVLQHPAPAVDLLVRGDREADVRAAIGAAFRDGGGARVRRVSEASLFSAEAAPLDWLRRMFGLEGWAMLALATAGTFAMLWLWVEALLAELGVRRAVGARRRDVRGYVLARAAMVAVGGVAAGCWAGLMLWDALGALVPGLPAWDAGAVLRYGGVLAVAALAGAWLPARRAARTAPVALLALDA